VWGTDSVIPEMYQVLVGIRSLRKAMKLLVGLRPDGRRS